MNEKTLIELSEDIRSKKISSSELTEFFLNRIKEYDSKLNSFITVTEEYALERAKIADKQIANIFEALIGALYLDGGIMPCKALILNTVWEHRKEGWKSTNYKGKLIEFCHLKNFENPIFKLKDKFGPDHERTFEIQVIIGKRIYSSGFGSNKKTAEQVAAQLALEELGATY